MGLADRCAGGAEKRDDLGGSKQHAAHKRDIAKPSREIIQLASEDQHGAGNGDSGQRDKPGDRSGDRLLDLLQRRFPEDRLRPRKRMRNR